MATLDTRADWKKVKEKYGIPDKVCKFSLGEKLDEFAKREAALGNTDYALLARAQDAIAADLRTYAAALAKMDPTRFKGKHSADPKANFAKAKEHVKTLLERTELMRETQKSLSEPMLHLAKVFATVLRDFQAVDRNNHGSIDAFYGKHIRNTIGLSVATALKQPIGDAVKADLREYQRLANEADQLMNHTDGTPAQAHALLVQALQRLGRHMK